MKILFLLKHRVNHNYDGTATRLSSGLDNSIRFTVDMLKSQGMDVAAEHVVDGNCIDRETHKHKPDVVVLEAFWATPDKVSEVAKLHPKVKWVVRSHSDMPFLASEGKALGWIQGYLDIDNVNVGCNSIRLFDELNMVLCPRPVRHLHPRIMYLPNFYPVVEESASCGMSWIGMIGFLFMRLFKPRTIDIGCFGAPRLLKNHLNQAVAAIHYADMYNLKLRFHINTLPINEANKSVESNLDSMFAATHGRHDLVKHGWLKHDEFKQLVSEMDIGMQVSFSETFNIVAADLVDSMVPVVVSDEVSWTSPECHAKPTNVKDICAKLEHVARHGHRIAKDNKARLASYSRQSAKIWQDELAKLS